MILRLSKTADTLWIKRNGNKTSKKIEKFLKKVLTSSKKCDIISKLSERTS